MAGQTDHTIKINARLYGFDREGAKAKKYVIDVRDAFRDLNEAVEYYGDVSDESSRKNVAGAKRVTQLLDGQTKSIRKINKLMAESSVGDSASIKELSGALKSAGSQLLGFGTGGDAQQLFIGLAESLKSAEKSAKGMRQNLSKALLQDRDSPTKIKKAYESAERAAKRLAKLRKRANIALEATGVLGRDEAARIAGGGGVDALKAALRDVNKLKDEEEKTEQEILGLIQKGIKGMRKELKLIHEIKDARRVIRREPLFQADLETLEKMDDVLDNIKKDVKTAAQLDRTKFQQKLDLQEFQKQIDAKGDYYVPHADGTRTKTKAGAGRDGLGQAVGGSFEHGIAPIRMSKLKGMPNMMEIKDKALRASSGFRKGVKGILKWADKLSFSAWKVEQGAQVIAGAMTSIAETAKRGENLQVLDVAFSKTVEETGLSLKSVREKLRGMVPDSEIKKMSQLAINAGLGAEGIETIAEAAAGAFVTQGKDPVSAFMRMTKGVAKGEREYLDEYGINMEHMDKLNREFAASIGKRASELTAQERQIAYLKDFEAKSAGLRKAGKDSKGLGDIAKMQAKVTNATDDFARSIAKIAKESGALDSFGELMDKVSGAMDGPEGAMITDLIGQSLHALVEAAGVGLRTFASLIPILSALVPIFRSAVAALEPFRMMIEMTAQVAGALANVIGIALVSTIKVLVDMAGDLSGILGMDDTAKKLKNSSDVMESSLDAMEDSLDMMGKSLSGASDEAMKASNAFAQTAASADEASNSTMQWVGRLAALQRQAEKTGQSLKKVMIDPNVDSVASQDFGQLAKSEVAGQDVRSGQTSLALSAIRMAPLRRQAMERVSHLSLKKRAAEGLPSDLGENLGNARYLEIRKSALAAAAETFNVSQNAVNNASGSDLEDLARTIHERAQLAKERYDIAKKELEDLSLATKAVVTEARSNAENNEELGRALNENISGAFGDAKFTFFDTKGDGQDFIDQFGFGGYDYDYIIDTFKKEGESRAEATKRLWEAGKFTVEANRETSFEALVGRLVDNLTKDATGAKKKKKINQATKELQTGITQLSDSLATTSQALEDRKEFADAVLDLAAFAEENGGLENATPEQLALFEKLNAENAAEGGLGGVGNVAIENLRLLAQGATQDVARLELEARGIEENRRLMEAALKRLQARARSGRRKEPEKFMPELVAMTSEGTGDARAIMGSVGTDEFSEQYRRLGAEYALRTAEAYMRGIEENKEDYKEDIKAYGEDYIQMYGDVLEQVQTGNMDMQELEDMGRVVDHLDTMLSSSGLGSMLSDHMQGELDAMNRAAKAAIEQGKAIEEIKANLRDIRDEAFEMSMDAALDMSLVDERNRLRMKALEELAGTGGREFNLFTGEETMAAGQFDPFNLPEHVQKKADKLSIDEQLEMNSLLRERERLEMKRLDIEDEIARARRLDEGEAGAEALAAAQAKMHALDTQIQLTNQSMDQIFNERQMTAAEEYHEKIKEIVTTLQEGTAGMAGNLIGDAFSMAVSDAMRTAKHDFETWEEWISAAAQRVFQDMSSTLGTAAGEATKHATGSGVLGSLVGGMAGSFISGMSRIFKWGKSDRNKQTREIVRELKRKDKEKERQLNVTVINNGLAVSDRTARQTGLAIKRYSQLGGKL